MRNRALSSGGASFRAGWVFAIVAASAALSGGTREVYVWQRQFDPGVAKALQDFAPEIDAACVLAAEVGWKNGRMEVARPSLDFAALGRLGKPVGLAVRIGDYAGTHASDDASAQALARIVGDTIARARDGGLVVTELQVDYDCAESKLAGYRKWLRAFRAATERTNTRLVVTALPTWLGHADFLPLVRSADGFVLQVHSLQRPGGPDASSSLCEPGRAMAWARQASAAGVSYRVALPTYGYVVGFDAAGKFLGLAAEGAQPSWPENARLRMVRADAPTMAKLARELESAPPAHCTGVIWFRLPVPRDRYNWSMPTLAAVVRGEVPASDVRVEAIWPEPQLAEIVVTNRGQAMERLPECVGLRWPPEARVLAADAMGGFRLEIRGGEAQGIVRAVDAPEMVLAPGRKVRIAWLRFSHEISLEVSVSAPP